MISSMVAALHALTTALVRRENESAKAERSGYL
jgi:hypothetical protein